jgi:hypothetical protein
MSETRISPPPKSSFYVDEEQLRAQLSLEIRRLELQLERLKKNNAYFEDSALTMYEDMLYSRRNMLQNLG